MAENQDLGKKVKRVKGEKAVQPEFFQEAKVICNGQEVMTVGGPKQNTSWIFGPETTRFSKGRKGRS